MSRKLPPLRSLQAFEAAARHLSFTRAAHELNVQQPAISRQVGDLETDLGVKLFERTKPALRLTNEGRQLYAALLTSFDAIEDLIARLRKSPGGPVLTVNVSIGIASCWLLARMADFRKRHPEIEVRLVTRDSNFDFDIREADIVVRFGDGEWPETENSLMFRETLFPICASSYLAQDKLLTTDELGAERLLHLDDIDHDGDWRRFFASADVKAPPPARDVSFNSYIVYLQAALNGEGIALGWRHLMDDHLKAGTLIKPSALSLRTARGYFCSLTPHASGKAEATIFRDWITGLAQE